MGIKLTKEVVDKIEEIAKNNDFNIAFGLQDGSFYADIAQYTPLGEDWSETVWFDGSYEDFVEEARGMAAAFDVDEAVSLWVDGRGENGVPNSISDLLEDAEWKKRTLQTFAASFDVADDDELAEKGKRYLYCANCGAELGDTFYTVQDNFLQTKYFDEPDGHDNAFCSQDCVMKTLMVDEVDNTREDNFKDV